MCLQRLTRISLALCLLAPEAYFLVAPIHIPFLPLLAVSAVVVRSAQVSSPAANLLSYQIASITSITGCPTFPGSVDCPRSGGIRITILGSNFGASGAYVLVGKPTL